MKGFAVFRERTAIGLVGYLAVGRTARAAFPVVFVICLAHFRGYGVAAAAQAVMVAATAFSAPIRARVLDVWGARKALPVQLIVYTASLLALSVTMSRAVSLAVIIALGLVASVSAPAIDPAVRTSWRSVAHGQEELNLLHTIDSIIEEAGFLLGPVLASALILTISYRWSPVVVVSAAFLNNLSAMMYSSVRSTLLADKQSPAQSSQGVPARRIQRLGRMIVGPIIQRDLRAIIAPVVLMGGAFGVLAITLPSIAAHNGSMATSGFLTAIISLGGLIGGFAYGALSSEATLQSRQSLLGILFGMPVAMLFLTRSPWLVAPILLISGLAVTPIYINSYLLIDGFITPEVKHEANSWVPVGNDVGYIAGISLGGLLLSKTGLAAALTAASILGVVLVVVSVRELIRSKRPDGASLQVAAEDISA